MKFIREFLYDHDNNYLRLSVVFALGHFLYNLLFLRNGISEWYNSLGYGFMFLIIIFIGDFAANFHKNANAPTLLANKIKENQIIPWIDHVHTLVNDPNEIKYRTDTYKNIVYIMDESDKDELINRLDEILIKNGF